MGKNNSLLNQEAVGQNVEAVYLEEKDCRTERKCNLSVVWKVVGRYIKAIHK